MNPNEFVSALVNHLWQSTVVVGVALQESVGELVAARHIAGIERKLT